MIPRYGAPPLLGQSYRLRPGAYGILVRDGRLLLTYQDQPEPDVQLPGGGIDPGEYAQQALHREVYEETGWSIAGARYIGSYRRFAWLPDYGFHAEKLCKIWLARPVRRLSAPTEPHHSPIWMTPRDARAHITDPGSLAFLRRAGVA